MKKLLALGGLLLLAPWVHAQDTSVAPNPATAAPPSGGGFYYPGQPIPAQSQPETNPAPPTGMAGKGQPRGLILTPGSDLDPDEPLAPAPQASSETHLVRKGDTLWDISHHYFNNPWYWPKLWALNPQITNPNWIYPNDLIRLRLPQASEAPAPPVAGPSMHIERLGGPPKGGDLIRDRAFVETGELAVAGQIIGSKEEKSMLSTLDEAYVKFDKGHLPRRGEHFTVYEPTRAIHHPLTGKMLGHIVQIFGEVQIQSVNDQGIARALIVDTFNPIERGFYVGPLRPVVRRVEPQVDRSSIAAILVAAIIPTKLVATGTVVFLDKGRLDGVKLGNRFFVTRRGDGYQPVLSTGPIYDPKFPPEQIAEILIVDLRDRLSTGVVTYAEKETRVGDRVETRVGY